MESEIVATQYESEENGMRVFASDTTLDALRLTLNSIIDLTSEFLNVHGYGSVLTGKLNQDNVEVRH